MGTYDIITAGTAQDLVNLVNQRIAEGWQPIGGVAIAFVDYEYLTNRVETFAQAMTQVNPIREQKREKAKQ